MPKTSTNIAKTSPRPELHHDRCPQGWTVAKGTHDHVAIVPATRTDPNTNCPRILELGRDKLRSHCLECPNQECNTHLAAISIEHFRKHPARHFLVRGSDTQPIRDPVGTGYFLANYCHTLHRPSIVRVQKPHIDIREDEFSGYCPGCDNRVDSRLVPRIFDRSCFGIKAHTALCKALVFHSLPLPPFRERVFLCNKCHLLLRINNFPFDDAASHQARAFFYSLPSSNRIGFPFVEDLLAECAYIQNLDILTRVARNIRQLGIHSTSGDVRKRCYKLERRVLDRWLIPLAHSIISPYFINWGSYVPMVLIDETWWLFWATRRSRHEAPPRSPR